MSMIKLDSIKVIMLNSFNSEITRIFEEYFNNNMALNQLISQINRFFESWDFCRFDIKNHGNINNSVISVNDGDFLDVKYPSWINNSKGKGCVVQSEKNKLNLIFKCNAAGTIKVHLRGLDFRNSEKNRVPILINYTNFIFNNDVIFDDYHLIWHDNPYTYNYECSNGEELSFKLEFKTIYDYYPELKYFKLAFNSQSENIEQIYNIFGEYINLKENSIKNRYNEKKDESYLSFDEENNMTTSDKLKSLTEKYNYLLKNYVELNNKFLELKNNYEELNIINNVTLNESLITDVINLKKYKNFSSQQLDSIYEYLSFLFLDSEINTKGMLNYVQIFSQELLDFIVNICNKYGLTYWLEGGTFLGAVRHEGFVPWDDDVDICMMRRDLKNFLRIFDYEMKKNNLDKFIEVGINKIYKNHFIGFIQIFYSSKHLLGAVDIFPYDFIQDPPENIKQLFIDERIKFHSSMLKGGNRENAEKKFFSNLNLSLEPKNHIISGVDGFRYNCLLLETKDIFPLTKFKFNNNEYYCPNNFNLYLTRTYGDYKSIPKKIKIHNRQKVLRYKKEMIDEFEKHISLLKDINYNMKNEY